MLVKLHIENVAVIERADIEFSAGLNVLTGETGAGKSIVIDSLGAILGERVSRDLVRTGKDKAIVTAEFSHEGDSDWFEENDIDVEDSVIIKRRITADGKSTAYINGTTVPAAVLRQLGVKLLDIHGQNDGRQLMDEDRHREYLDNFAVLDDDLAEYKTVYDKYRNLNKKLKSQKMDEAEKLEMAELLRSRVKELSEAEIKIGEEDELSAKRDLLRNAGRLTEALDEAYYILYSSNGSACEKMSEAESLTQTAARFAGDLVDTSKQITEARLSIEDAAECLREFRASLDFSEDEYDRLENRLKKLKTLQKKYRCDEAGLLDLLEKSADKLEQIDYSDEIEARLLADIAECKANLAKLSKKLHDKREIAANELKAKIEQGLRELSMPAVRFETEIKTVEEFSSFGSDEVRFLMSANAGENLGRISKIASGGELSRIMLVMKEVLSERDKTETMVFDEVDEGVSGIAAQRVGEKLSRLSTNKQVICVSHLAQIAAMADTHFKIEKNQNEGRTYTRLVDLDDEGRINELARLHGGENITLTTRASAAEQLEAAKIYKSKM